MDRKFTSYPVNNFTVIKTKMLNWAKQFNIFCLLDNHNYDLPTSPFECLLGAGFIKTIKAPSGKAFTGFQNFFEREKDWIFGHFSYDLKNEIENLSSQNFDAIQFPDLFFFVPEVVVILKKNILEIGIISGDSNNIYQHIKNQEENLEQSKRSVQEIKSRFSKDEYLKTIKKIQEHILRGDCYEINFCQEFFVENAEINPIDIYLKLSALSPNPFSGFYKLNDKYLLCASPERYLKKVGNKLFSQPIKGTVKRNLEDADDDERNKKHLLKSTKELSENVMVVDLVRNDLSKVCVEGSVKAEELFAIHTFPQVHQMISTVSGIVDIQYSFTEIIKATFPMGSMTGMPKRKVMELIEKYEKTKRGLFSGAVGYINPEKDFDFNVVIRSILYNAANKYISMQAGSAITFYSEAEKEYEECLIKIEAMKRSLE